MSITEDLEANIDIIDLVWKYAKLKKSWTNYKSICPFPWHSEKSPSFMVSPSKQLAYCFWCHKWWWPIKFIMDIENCEFRDAIEILWNITWIKVKNDFNKENYEEKKSLYSLYKDTAKYYKEALKKSPEVIKYLFDRWIDQETIEKFNFWYADNWVELYNYLKSKWYSDEIIWESMIFVDVKARKDKFINRIIFPIQNQRWDYVALAWRIIWNWEPKYLNSPATKIYDKSSILYWLFDARNHITKEDFIIITEWYMDTISLQNAWFKNTVAVSWTALTEKHLTIIKRLTNKIYLCFDNDTAWENAIKLSLEILTNKWFEVKIIILDWWKDPDEIIKNWWNFQKLIDEAVSPIWYYIKKSNFDLNSIDEKRKLLVKLLELTKHYSSDIEKDFYLKEIAKLLNLTEKIIYDAFNKTKFSVQKNHIENNKNIFIWSEELAIWYILLWNENKKILDDILLFKEYLSNDLKSCLEKKESFLNELDLDKKEKYRWLTLEIDETSKLKTNENISDTLTKLAKKINMDIYKKITGELKEKINKWDMEALVKYNDVIKKAKVNGLK